MLRSTNTLNYDHVLLKPSEQIGLHHFNTWEMSYVISGSGQRILGDTKENFQMGEIVLVVPNMPHQWIFSPDQTDENGNIENITISFGIDFLPKLSQVIPEYQPIASWFENLNTSIKFAKNDCEKISILLRRMEKEIPDMRINTLLQLLTEVYHCYHYSVAGNFESPISVIDKIKKAKVYMNCNYQRSITIDDIAYHVGMNRTSLCIAFKKVTKQTIIGGYLTDFRIRVAKYLLKNENGTIEDCCYKSGFNDVPHFNRIFKKKLGISPSQYRSGIPLASTRTD
jgi:AraC-like DNA-binding protein